jgi:hypothetical protein
LPSSFSFQVERRMKKVMATRYCHFLHNNTTKREGKNNNVPSFFFKLILKQKKRKKAMATHQSLEGFQYPHCATL